LAESMTSGGAQSKTKGALEGIKDAFTGDDEDEGDKEKSGSRRRSASSSRSRGRKRS
jgi:gas vesicle structural protein